LIFNDEIDACQECANLINANRLKITEKPYVTFKVEEKWLPQKGVNILFVAESPPWNGKQSYFYNAAQTSKRTNLRKEMFRHLYLPSLEAFRDKSYFLVDAIKCRLNKKDKSNVPSEVLKKCSTEFLGREIKTLKPKTIFVLGDSAKKALQCLHHTIGFSEFADLTKHRVTQDYDRGLSGYRVILCVYPGGQTRKHEANIRRAFSKLE